MNPVERFEAWINSWIEKARIAWGQPLYKFFLGGTYETIDQVSKVTREGADLLEKNLRDQLKPLLARLRETEGLPDDIKVILDQATEEPGWIHLAALLPYLIGMLMGMGMETVRPVASLGAYFLDNLVRSARLDPASVITAWRRDKVTYEKYFDDLRSQGWSDDRIEALKFVTQFLPTADEQTHWLAREVYEPEMVSKYGLDAELPVYEETDFAKVGVTPEQMRNKWMAHWVHASWGQVLDMYHRGELTYEDVWRWFRVVEIPPYWRDKLIAISWSLPNRIETRMMARYGLVDKTWLVKHLERIGLHEDYRSVAADFMLAMGIRMDISARYSKGWLNADEVKTEIAAYGMSEDINDRLYKWIVKNVGPERVETERFATATEIMKAVKKGYITWSEGVERLERMGYSDDEADFKLTVYVGVESGSPETYMEFVDMTERYRKAQGLEAQIPPPELIEASKALNSARIALRDAESEKKVGKELAPYLKTLSDAEYRYRALLVSWEEEKKKAK